MGSSLGGCPFQGPERPQEEGSVCLEKPWYHSSQWRPVGRPQMGVGRAASALLCILARASPRVWACPWG